MTLIRGEVGNRQGGGNFRVIFHPDFNCEEEKTGHQISDFETKMFIE